MSTTTTDHDRSESNLFRRIARRLAGATWPMHIHKCPERGRGYHDLGRYYITDDRNIVRETHVDLRDKWDELAPERAGGEA